MTTLPFAVGSTDTVVYGCNDMCMSVILPPVSTSIIPINCTDFDHATHSFIHAHTRKGTYTHPYTTVSVDPAAKGRVVISATN